MLTQLFCCRILHVFFEINYRLDFQKRICQICFSAFFVKNKFKYLTYNQVIELLQKLIVVKPVRLILAVVLQMLPQ